jgi:hypothetical protein
MSSDEQVAVMVNGELMLARQRTLEDGTVQYVNRFGLALEGAQPVQQEKPKAKPRARARKKTAE